MSNPENLKKRVSFKKNDSRINKHGRPPRLVSHINRELKEAGYEPVTNAHVLDAFQTLINLPLSQIAAIANKDILYKDETGKVVYLSEGDNYPILYRLAAAELIGKRKGEYLERLLDRVFGRAKQAVEVSGEIEVKQITGMVIK